jgi:hypothetical protein
VTRFGQGRGGDGRNIADANETYPRITDRREEQTTVRDGVAEGEKPLHEEVGPQRREAHTEVADPTFDGCVVAEEANRGVFFVGRVLEQHDLCNAGSLGQFGEADLLLLCRGR